MYYHGPRVQEREFATSKAVRPRLVCGRSSSQYPVSQVKTIQKAFSGPAPGTAARRQLVKRGYKSKAGHITLNDVAVACMSDVLQHEIDKVGKPRGLWPLFVYYADKLLPTRIGLFIPISVRKPGDWSMRCVATRVIRELRLRRNLSTGSSVWMTPMPRSQPVTGASLYTHLHRAKGELGLIKRSRLMPFRPSARHTERS